LVYRAAMPASVAQQICNRLALLSADTTMCPGELARELGATQEGLRRIYLELARDGQIEITQGGQPVAELADLKGPYRVRLLRPVTDA